MVLLCTLAGLLIRTKMVVSGSVRHIVRDGTSELKTFSSALAVLYCKFVFHSVQTVE